MKRSVAMVVAGLALLSTLPGQSVARGVAREEVQEYGSPRGVGAETDYPGIMLQFVTFEPMGARKVTLSVEDDVSDNVLVEVEQNGANIATFCTAMDKPLTIDPSATLEVTLYVGPCEDQPAFATKGIVRALFPAAKR